MSISRNGHVAVSNLRFKTPINIKVPFPANLCLVCDCSTGQHKSSIIQEPPARSGVVQRLKDRVLWFVRETGQSLGPI